MTKRRNNVSSIRTAARILHVSTLITNCADTKKIADKAGFVISFTQRTLFYSKDKVRQWFGGTNSREQTKEN